jgi:hypothetical protein
MNKKGLMYVVAFYSLIAACAVLIATDAFGQALASRDTLLHVWERGGADNMEYPLMTRRYVSIVDCRKERDWMIAFNQITGGDPIWITCSLEKI